MSDRRSRRPAAPAPPPCPRAPLRYLAERPFPAYAYLPGRDPHPSRDPEGHSFGEEAAPGRYLPASRWRENADYLFGVDLYNHGFLWEAHEAWEGIWQASKSDELQALHLQGLIQCAAACLKVPMGQPRGLERLTELGTEKLERVAARAGARFMGVDLPRFVEGMRAFASASPRGIEGRPPLVLTAAG